MREDQARVLILGGGPAGLLAAQALKKEGFRVTVFEQDASPETRPRDWNFGIYWAQSPLADCLPADLCAQLDQVQVDSRKPFPEAIMPIHNSESGELLLNAPTPMNLRLHRGKFLNLISADIDIRRGKKLVKVDTNDQVATAHFADGSSESGNLLIGAEGAHSVVRNFLVGPEKAALVKLPLATSATITTLPEETVKSFQKLHPRNLVAFHPVGMFSWVGVHEADPDVPMKDWKFMLITSWLIDDENYDPTLLKGSSILEDWKRRADVMGEPFKSFHKTIPDDAKCWHSQLSNWIPQEWDNHNGMITLIGDAAHPMTFHRGQGFNNAVLDVATLAKELAGKDVLNTEQRIAAINAYESEMRTRGAEAVIGSRENSLATHDWNKLMDSPLMKMGLKQRMTAS